MVTITGPMPRKPVVAFGGSTGSQAYADRNRVIVETPAHPAGAVTVVVSGGGGTVTLPDAFRYLGEEPDPEPEPEEEEEAGPPPRTARAPFTAANGLRIDAFGPGHPLLRLQTAAWADGGCTAAVCSAVML